MSLWVATAVTSGSGRHLRPARGVEPDDRDVPRPASAAGMLTSPQSRSSSVEVVPSASTVVTCGIQSSSVLALTISWLRFSAGSSERRSRGSTKSRLGRPTETTKG